jgi:hypothetical protein
MTADMVAVVLVYLAMAIAISAVAIHEDRLQKGFNPNAKDGDGDGLIQDGTKWERKVKK